MKKLFCIFSLALLFLGMAFSIQADPIRQHQYVVMTSSNDPTNNVLLVYNSKGKLLQSIPTGGMGGAIPFNTSGGIARHGKLIAVVNNLSSSVSVFKQNPGILELQQIIPVSFNPISVAFGHGHLYILGSATVESHKIDKKWRVDQFADGSAFLLGDGSAVQVGVLEDELIITEADNLVEFAELHQGVLSGVVTRLSSFPTPQSPLGVLTHHNKAYIAHFEIGAVALLKHNQLKTITSTGQLDPCWLALSGHWLFTTNPISQTISRFKVGREKLILSASVAAQTLEPGRDIAALGKFLAVIIQNVIETQNVDETQTYLSQYRIDKKGNLHLLNTVPTANNANGIVIAPWPTAVINPIVNITGR